MSIWKSDIRNSIIQSSVIMRVGHRTIHYVRNLFRWNPLPHYHGHALIGKVHAGGLLRGSVNCAPLTNPFLIGHMLVFRTLAMRIKDAVSNDVHLLTHVVADIRLTSYFFSFLGCRSCLYIFLNGKLAHLERIQCIKTWIGVWCINEMDIDLRSVFKWKISSDCADLLNSEWLGLSGHVGQRIRRRSGMTPRMVWSTAFTVSILSTRVTQ